MRCVCCGWIVGEEHCPCGFSKPDEELTPLPNRTRIVSRLGRGPSMSYLWMPGEVVAHQGLLHLVRANGNNYWVELDDMLADAPEREQRLRRGTRVWALWVDGRWYRGQVDGAQGALRHITWDDGDSMWLECGMIVPEVVQAQTPQIDTVVLAPRWDGDVQPGRVEGQNGSQFRIVFPDGEETWASEEELAVLPPNPFLE